MKDMAIARLDTGQRTEGTQTRRPEDRGHEAGSPRCTGGVLRTGRGICAGRRAGRHIYRFNWKMAKLRRMILAERGLQTDEKAETRRLILHGRNNG